MLYVETKSHIVNSVGSVHRSGRGEDLAVQLWGKSAGILGALHPASLRPSCWPSLHTSASREGGAKEERNCCPGQRPAVFLGSACSINSAEEAPQSQPVENWTLEAGAASCSLMGPEVLQGRAVLSVPTLLAFPSSVVGPPTAIPSPSNPLQLPL